jgi:hypothetical protein
MGTEQKNARYIGAVNDEWRPVNSVKHAGQGDTRSLLEGLKRFPVFWAAIAYYFRGVWHRGECVGRARRRAPGGVVRCAGGVYLPLPGCLAPTFALRASAGKHGESASVGEVASDGPGARHRTVLCVVRVEFAYHFLGAWHRGECSGRGGWVGRARCQAPIGVVRCAGGGCLPPPLLLASSTSGFLYFSLRGP